MPPAAIPCAQLPVVCPQELKKISAGRRVKTANRFSHGTPEGFCFIALEDETSRANTIVTPKLLEKLRPDFHLESSLLIAGKLQNSQSVILVFAGALTKIHEVGFPLSRDPIFTERLTATKDVRGSC